MEKLKEALALIKDQINELEAASEIFYNAGDNKNGNIRKDAADRLKINLSHLVVGYDYMVRVIC